MRLKIPTTIYDQISFSIRKKHQFPASKIETVYQTLFRHYHLKNPTTMEQQIKNVNMQKGFDTIIKTPCLMIMSSILLNKKEAYGPKYAFQRLGISDGGDGVANFHFNQYDKWLNNTREWGKPPLKTELLDDSKPASETSNQSTQPFPFDFLCPITGTDQLMFDPVIDANGNTYEREEIERWLKDHNRSPADNTELAHKNLVPNKNVKRSILSFLAQHEGLWETDRIYESAKLKVNLVRAVTDGKTNNIRRLVAQDKRLLWKPITHNETLLQIACNQKDTEVLSIVITQIKGYFKKVLGKSDGTDYFQVAAKNMGAEGAKVIAKKLEWVQADIQSQLFKAIALGNLGVLKVCLELGAKLNVANNEGNYPLHTVVLHKQHDVLQYMLAQNVDIELATKQHKNTALHVAAKEGDRESIKLLISAGANVKAKNRKNQKPKEIARVANKPKTVQFIENYTLRLQLQPILKPMQEKIDSLEKQVHELQEQLAKKMEFGSKRESSPRLFASGTQQRADNMSEAYGDCTPQDPGAPTSDLA